MVSLIKLSLLSHQRKSGDPPFPSLALQPSSLTRPSFLLPSSPFRSIFTPANMPKDSINLGQ